MCIPVPHLGYCLTGHCQAVAGIGFTIQNEALETIEEQGAMDPGHSAPAYACDPRTRPICDLHKSVQHAFLARLLERYVQPVVFHTRHGAIAEFLVEHSGADRNDIRAGLCRAGCSQASLARRRIYANWQASIPSRFIEELPDASVEHIGSAELARDARVMAATKIRRPVSIGCTMPPGLAHHSGLRSEDQPTTVHVPGLLHNARTAIAKRQLQQVSMFER
jgi:hypothetical protein